MRIGEERREATPPKSCSGDQRSKGAPATDVAPPGHGQGWGDDAGDAGARERKVQHVEVKGREIRELLWPRLR